MRKLLFKYTFMSLWTLVLLAGCGGEVSQVGLGPTLSLATPLPSVTLSPTQVTTLPSPTETAPATITSIAELELLRISTPTPIPSATATPTATPTTPALLQPNMTTVPIMCSQVKSYINIQQESNSESWRLMDFVFEREDMLTFLMWSYRPYSGPTPTPLTGSPTELSRSQRVLLKGQTWDFNSENLVRSPVTDQIAIQSPCDQDCPLEVIGVAPNNSWQLLQITDAPTDYQGFWLINNETVKNLVPYVPFYSQWQWSSDSRLLWLIYALHDISGESYGFESMIVDLASPTSPQIVFQSWNQSESQVLNLLSPDEYELVFSPVEKTVLSYESVTFSEPNPPNNQLEVYRFDVSQNPPQLLDIYKARYPFLIDWSDTLQDFVVLELSATGAIIYALNHAVVYEIPMEVIKQMPQLVGIDGQIRTDISTEVDMLILSTILKRVAISPELQQVVLMDQRRAWAFSCSD